MQNTSQIYGNMVAKAVNTLKEEFEKIETMLYNEYGKDVRELEIILNQVYEKQIY